MEILRPVIGFTMKRTNTNWISKGFQIRFWELKVQTKGELSNQTLTSTKSDFKAIKPPHK